MGTQIEHFACRDSNHEIAKWTSVVSKSSSFPLLKLVSIFFPDTPRWLTIDGREEKLSSAPKTSGAVGVEEDLKAV